METLSGVGDYIMTHRDELGLMFVVLTSLVGLVDGQTATRFALIVVFVAWLVNYRPIR